MEKKFELLVAEHEGNEFVIDIPVLDLTVQNGRILCATFNPKETKTKGGLILADVTGGLKYTRYFVVAVAHDVQNIKVLDPETKELRSLKRGDELVPFLPDAKEWQYPDTIDRTGKDSIFYKTIHETEISGVVPLNEANIRKDG